MSAATKFMGIENPVISENLSVSPGQGRSVGHFRTVTVAELRSSYAGLCELCNLRSSCKFPRSMEHKVTSCEEFDGRGSEPGHKGAVSSAARHSLNVVSRDTVTNSLARGLCATCEKFDTCQFPKPEGGVWQCEEFE